MVESDIDAVQEIERHSDTAPHWNRDDYRVSIEIDNGQNLKRLAMIAEVAGEPVGFAVVRLVGGASWIEAELESIVVAAEWRGRGLGTSLLLESALGAKERGASRLDLEVRASNSAAIRLYGRAGFCETGRRRRYYRDPEEDAVLMSVIL